MNLKLLRSALLLLLLASAFAFPQSAPKVLIVTAHPDDETGTAVTAYKIVHELKGTVDLAVITNGEGGYKYSTLANEYYGVHITDEATGRELLPTIRKRELMNAGKIIGLRNFFFFDQKDHKYTTNIAGVLDSLWNTRAVKERLASIILTNKYDYIFCLLPVPETHAHHKSASIIALQTVLSLPMKDRPVVLGIGTANKSDTVKPAFSSLKDFPETAVNTSVPPFTTDRTTPFGFKNKLNYKIIANWVIAEHKSQGAMQLYMNTGDIEQFYFFAVNSESKIPAVQALFDKLKIVPYITPDYKE